MTIAEILLQDYDMEISNTRRTLERVPEDKPEWVPHAKSMKMGKLAMHCASLPLFGYYIMEDDGMDMAASKRPKTAFLHHERSLPAAARGIFRQVPCRDCSRQRCASFCTLEIQFWRASDRAEPALHDLSHHVLRPPGASHGTTGRLPSAERYRGSRTLRPLGG